MKEATEVTEAAMVATEEVIPLDLEARPHGVCPEVCAAVETSKCVVGVVWVAAEVGPKETNLTKKRGIKKKKNFNAFSCSESALLIKFKTKTKLLQNNRTRK